MNPQLLAIDAGNTQVVIGLHNRQTWTAQWRITTERVRTADEWASILTGLFGASGQHITLAECRTVAIASVVPHITTALFEMISTYARAEPFIVRPGVRTGVKLLVDNPREVGADRVVNSLAARERYGGPAIVVDFGTSTNIDVINRDGDYIGGAIAPGLMVSADALFSRAAKLQEVELVRPPRAIGRNTVECMQSGIVLGYAGLVERLVAEIKRELGPAQVVATGGLVRSVAQATDIFDHVDPDLTLEGLRLMYDLNRVATGGVQV